MNTGNPVVETSLARVESRWKWIKFLKRSFVLGSVLSVATLGFGLLLSTGWIVERAVAVSGVVLLCIVGLLSWAILAIWIAGGAPESPRLANDLERADPRLMDRMTTLVHLGKPTKDDGRAGFKQRIIKQVQQLFAARKPPSVYSYGELQSSLAVMVAIIAATFWFYHQLSPWQKMLAADRARLERMATLEQQTAEPSELPATTITEELKPWGEVRIIEPAADLKVTKIDVVPLRIEAAANQTLSEVSWLTSINGEEEKTHVLPPPPEPRYAVYTPVIYLEQHELSDWEVMTYYARARTEGSNSYVSQVYFLEVRPFEEDLLKLPGGSDGKAYEWLSELTSLIRRQQQVIRETHRLAQAIPEDGDDRMGSRELAEAEKDLSAAARHLSADITAGMERNAIEHPLQDLTRAEQSLLKAGDLLGNGVLTDAQVKERLALSELVAARRMFQEAISANPDAFGQPQESESLADLSEALKQMAEFRNEANAAREFVQKILNEQRQLQMRFIPQTKAKAQKLAVEEQELRERFETFAEQHPQPFKDVQPQVGQAGQCMEKAERALSNNNSSGFTALTQASSSLQSLKEALDGQSAKDKLTETYRLKQMLEQQASTLDHASQPGSSGRSEEIARTAGQARQTLERLRQLIEQEPIRSAFDTPLREALSAENQQAVDQQLAQAEQSTNPQQQKSAAAGACTGLKQICDAFSQSEPALIRAGRENDALSAGEQDGFTRGMSELESLLKRSEAGQSAATEDHAKQARQALRNIRQAMRDREESDREPGDQVFAELDKFEKTLNEQQEPLDLQHLKKLLDQLRRYSVELASHEQQSNSLSVVNMDPARLPSAYRGRIQKYFEKLSEK